MFCCNRLLGRLLCQKTCFYCRFVVFCRKLFVFCNFYAPLHTIFLFCRFLSCFSNAFSSVLFLYLFMNNSLCYFCRVLQNVFACIFFLVATLFFILVISALLFPFVTERFLADFSTAFSPKTAYFLPFCGISLAVHVHCKKIPLVVFGNCRFILQFFVTVVLFFTIYY